MDNWAERALSTTASRTASGKLPLGRTTPSPPAVEAPLVAAPPGPYPEDLQHDVQLQDGARIRIRPIRPDDEAGLVGLYGRLGEYTAYQRFFTSLRRLPADWFRHFANVDYRRRLALVAEHLPGDRAEIIGVGRYEPTDEPGVAELAFVVEDGWQGRGVGTILFERILAAAEERGIRRFRAYVLAGNHRMLGLIAAHAHIEERRTQDGVAELLLTRREATS